MEILVGTVNCPVHGEQRTERISLNGGPGYGECVHCVTVLEGLGNRVTFIGGANLPKPKEHEGQYVYGQD